MDGRLAATLSVALLLAMALAGCASQPHFENAGASEVSARANLDGATHAAKAWDKSAKLVAVAAAETSDENGDVPADPNVGNGLAVQWTYAFTNAAGDSRYVDASADGTIVIKNETQAVDEYGAYMGGYAAAYQSYRSGSPNPEPLGDWPVDSDGALRAAMENATFARAAKGPNATLILALGETGAPGWTILASSGAMNVVALVNETSGDLTAVHDLSRYAWQDAAMSGTTTTSAAPEKPASVRAPRPVDVKDSETLTSQKQEWIVPFHADAAMKGRLNMSATFQGDAEYLQWAIKSGDKIVQSGQLGALAYGGGFPATSSAWSVSLKEGGDYTLVTELFTLQSAVPLGSATYDLAMHLAPPSS